MNAVRNVSANRPVLLRLLLIGGLLAVNTAIGLGRLPLPTSLVLAAAAAAGLAFLALRSMALALTLLVVSSGIVSFSIGTGTMSTVNVTMLMVGLFSAVWLLRMLVTRHVRFVRTPLNWPLLAFLIAAALSWMNGLVVAGSLHGMRIAGLTVQAGQYGIFLLTAALFLLAANHRVSERTLQLWTGFVILAGVAVMVAGIALNQYYVLPQWRGGLYMWPVALLLAQILFNSDLDGRLKLLGVGFLGVWAYWALKIALTYKSIVAPAALAFMVIIFFRSKRLFAVTAILAVIVVAGLGSGRINQALISSEQYSALPIRSSLWLDVFRLGVRSPVLGLGPANYVYYWSDPSFHSLSYEQVNPYAWKRQVYAPPAHNMFADLFAQTGAVGLLLFTWVLAGGIALAWKALRRPLSPFARAYASAVLAGFIAQIVASFVFAEWLLPYVYNIGFAGFPQAAYAWLLLGTLAWLGTPGEG